MLKMKKEDGDRDDEENQHEDVDGNPEENKFTTLIMTYFL